MQMKKNECRKGKLEMQRERQTSLPQSFSFTSRSSSSNSSREKGRKDIICLWKVDRVLANHSLSSTASQGTSNIPVSWFLLLGCYRQAQTKSQKDVEWEEDYMIKNPELVNGYLVSVSMPLGFLIIRSSQRLAPLNTEKKEKEGKECVFNVGKALSLLSRANFPRIIFHYTRA